METKYIIAAVIAGIVVIAGGILAYDFITDDLGILNSKGSTEFDNYFMSGKFVGNVVEIKNNSDNFSANYKDNDNNIQYNMTTCTNGSFVLDYLSVNNNIKVETREYNGVEWNIMFSQTVPESTGNDSDARNKSMDLYLCEATEGNQSYLLFIALEKTDGIAPKLQSDGSLYCEFYTDYIIPLLKSAELKENENVPGAHELLGFTESEFILYSDLFTKYLNGEIDEYGNAIP